ncbi:MAG TPA: MerR family transcriptional regulator [Candidatus Binataceae bacterium]|jgi:MerR family transcriptional regulator/heat shock protein HspR|nr:MerR family transcriptional regulator [Candidatus Binataceae bacterium]
MAARGKSNRKGARPQLRFYSRSVVCGLCGVTESELSLWESEELVTPARLMERGRRFEPLYDEAALRRIRLIRTLADELEVNLAGIGVILHLLEQLDH